MMKEKILLLSRLFVIHEGPRKKSWFQNPDMLRKRNEYEKNWNTQIFKEFI